MKIAVIGLGVAGVSVLRELSKQLNDEQKETYKIIIYASKKEWGTGFPYQNDDESLLINQYTETMSIDLDDKEDFMNWVKQNKTVQTPYHTHLPRKWFGEYLRETAENCMKELKTEIRFETVENVKLADEGHYTVISGESIEKVDAVYLTTGHLAYQDPYNLKGKDGYIYNPYPAEEVLKFPQDTQSIGLIGSGLTALDAMLYIQKNYPRIKVTFYSRNGLFSSVRGDEPPVTLHYFCDDRVKDLLNHMPELSLDKVKEWFYKEMEEHHIDANWVWNHLGKGTLEGMALDLEYSKELGEFQSMIRHMRTCYPFIWNALSDDEKDLFLSKYSDQWQRFKAPIPQNTARLLIRQINENAVRLVSGLESIEKTEQGFKLLDSEKNSYSETYLINCTGQNMNVSDALPLQTKLVQNLIKNGQLSPHKYGGVKIDYPSMSVIDTSDFKHSLFKTYGQMVSGVQFGNNNVELISLSARSGVRHMIAAIQKQN